MQKINFVNNTQPYLSADILNQLQDNVEDAINNANTIQTNSIIFPDGTIIERGILNISEFSASGNYYVGTVNFENEFDNAPIVIESPLWNGNGDLYHHVKNVTTTGATFELSANVGNGVMYNAIGKVGETNE